MLIYLSTIDSVQALNRMTNSAVDVAKEAFANANYHLAMDLFEQVLRHEQHPGDSATPTVLLMDTYFGYADSLARTGNIKESFDVYAFICSRMGGQSVSLDKLKHLTIGLIDSVSPMSRGTAGSGPGLSSVTTVANNSASNTVAMAGHRVLCDSSSDGSDESANGELEWRSSNPLACPICEDVLMWPVTAVCGHTFCRQCCFGQTHCRMCGKKFLMYADCLKQDVLVSRLVEKWWSPDLQAQLINVETKKYLRQNMLDEALKSCNASLEKCK